VKLLVVGPYPPAPGPEPARTVAAVELLAGEGHEVEVLAPVAGAAHHNAHLRGVLGMSALRRLASDFDGLVLRVQPGVFLSDHPGRARWMAEVSILSAALRPWRHVTLELESLIWLPVGGRASNQLWSQADAIVVGKESDARRLAAEGGVSADRIEVRPPPRLVHAARTGDWDQSAASLVDVTLEGRRRAAMDRALSAAAGGVAAATAAPRSEGQMSMWAKDFVRRVLGPYAELVFGPLRQLRKATLNR